MEVANIKPQDALPFMKTLRNNNEFDEHHIALCSGRSGGMSFSYLTKTVPRLLGSRSNTWPAPGACINRVMHVLVLP